MKNGKIYCTGTPQEVLTIENMKELFRVKAEIIVHLRKNVIVAIF